MDELEGILSDYNIIFLDGLDEAILGYSYNSECDKYTICYSVSKIIEILQTRDGMTLEEAEEFYDYNIDSLVYCTYVFDRILK